VTETIDNHSGESILMIITVRNLTKRLGDVFLSPAVILQSPILFRQQILPPDPP
jgi:hypothetical protein